MRLINRLAIAAVAVLALAACSTFDPPKQVDGEQLNDYDQGSLSPFVWRPTECSGKNCARVWLPGTEGGPAVAEIIGAKESSSVSMTYNPETGEIGYTATDTKGLEAQNFPLIADGVLAAELGETWTNLAPEIRGGVIEALKLAIGVP